MGRKILESLYCEKLSRELAAYKASTLEMDKEEIYGAAYEIDCVISIYETLIETTERNVEDFLKSMIVFPGLLLFLYHEWLKWRTMGIGGSDASVIAGVNPYRSVFQLWKEKTEQE